MSETCYTFDPWAAALLGSGLVFLFMVVPLLLCWFVYVRNTLLKQVAPEPPITVPVIVEPTSQVQRPPASEMNNILVLARGIRKTAQTNAIMINAQSTHLLALSVALNNGKIDEAKVMLINVRHRLAQSHIELMNIHAGADLICAHSHRLTATESHASNGSAQA